MKQSVRRLVVLFIAVFSLGMTANAQSEKCPLTGGWVNFAIGGDWGEAAIWLFPEKKVGQNPYMKNRPGNGYISMSDVCFENEKNYNLIYNKTTASDTYEFTVQYYVGKQLRTGKIQLKKVGTKLTITGLDPNMKKQPIQGKTFEKTQNQ